MEKNAKGNEPRPRVGLGILILNQKGEVLLGLRNSSHGAGEWSFPGGHVEFGETIFETAKREVLEEVGLTVNEMELISVGDEMRYIKSDGKHYVNLGVLARYAGGEPTNMEPHKCAEWRWFPLDALPERIFEGTEMTLNNYKAKKFYQPRPI
jgi:8-oxo-dGTP diphosphatase